MIRPHPWRIISGTTAFARSIALAICVFFLAVAVVLAEDAVGRASRTLWQAGWFEVLETRGHVEDGQGGVLPGHSKSCGWP
jgi:hypothetical protein